MVARMAIRNEEAEPISGEPVNVSRRYFECLEFPLAMQRQRARLSALFCINRVQLPTFLSQGFVHNQYCNMMPVISELS
jgi:hypothetical protein